MVIMYSILKTCLSISIANLPRIYNANKHPYTWHPANNNIDFNRNNIIYLY